jgi:hypothetical protein
LNKKSPTLVEDFKLEFYLNYFARGIVSLAFDQAISIVLSPTEYNNCS